MINQLTQTFVLTAAQAATLNGMMPFGRNDWERGTAAIIEIRASIATQLRAFQNGKCCYCGLLYDETGRAEIDHIAPKKSRINEYPEFSFHVLNLALACQLCNSSTMKHEYDSILTYNANYQNCTFKIVHPYLDDHTLHYRWSHGASRVLITGISIEAQESIRLFKLDGEHRTVARAKQRNHEMIIAMLNIPSNTINRIKRAVNFKV